MVLPIQQIPWLQGQVKRTHHYRTELVYLMDYVCRKFVEHEADRVYEAISFAVTVIDDRLEEYAEELKECMEREYDMEWKPDDPEGADESSPPTEDGDAPAADPAQAPGGESCG